MSVPGVDQHLVHEARPSMVAGVERDDGGQVAPGAVAGNRQPARIDAVPLGVVGDPARGGDRILDGGGELVLGRQTVVDGHDDGGDGIGDRAADLVVALQVADHPAAAMEVDERRLRPAFVDPVAAIVPQRDRPVGPGCRERQHLGHRLGLRLQDGAGCQVGLACLRRRQRFDRRPARGDDQVAHLLGLGMQFLLGHAGGAAPLWAVDEFTSPDSSGRRRPRAGPR